jgi:hypothetical protein
MCCAFSVIAGSGVPHSRQGREEKKEAFPIHWFSVFIGGGA